MASIEKLYVKNFKCFGEHTIFFNNSTIMIGANSAGKTTVIEALRILGLTTARFQTTNALSSRPEWLSNILPLTAKGLHISAKAIDTDLDLIFHRYGEPPAIIEAAFSNSVSIHIYINSEVDVFAVIKHNGNLLTTKGKLGSISIPNVRVLPQIVPLTKNEDFVTKETLRRNRFSKRTSGNYRNNLLANIATEEYQVLQDMISQTWGRIKIHRVYREDEHVYLDMRDGDFVSEIYYMGHGIQMWIQMLWFIVQSKRDSIIVLDEPDVYMHADLQRKMIRMLKDGYSQVIIATHSLEIMSEVLPENILIIDRYKPQSILADGYPALQTAISGMGSIHNVHLSRLLNDKRYLYVEGYDMDILRIFYDKLFPEEVDPLDHFPHITTGGWGGWKSQKEDAIQLLREIPNLKVYFFFDRDYHSDDEIRRRYNEAKSNHIRIHIWHRKELENYALVNTAIARFITKKRPELEYKSLCTEIEALINAICEEEKTDVICKVGSERFKKKIEPNSSEYFLVKNEVDSLWLDQESRYKIVPGKDIMKKISNHCKLTYNVSFSVAQIVSSMQKAEINPEIAECLRHIKEGK